MIFLKIMTSSFINDRETQPLVTSILRRAETAKFSTRCRKVANLNHHGPILDRTGVTKGWNFKELNQERDFQYLYPEYNLMVAVFQIKFALYLVAKYLINNVFFVMLGARSDGEFKMKSPIMATVDHA